MTSALGTSEAVALGGGLGRETHQHVLVAVELGKALQEGGEVAKKWLLYKHG